MEAMANCQRSQLNRGIGRGCSDVQFDLVWQESACKLEEGLLVNPDAIEEAMAQALARMEPASQVSKLAAFILNPEWCSDPERCREN